MFEVGAKVERKGRKLRVFSEITMSLFLEEQPQICRVPGTAVYCPLPASASSCLIKVFSVDCQALGSKKYIKMCVCVSVCVKYVNRI